MLDCPEHKWTSPKRIPWNDNGALPEQPPQVTLMLRPVALAGVGGSVIFHSAPAAADGLEADSVWYWLPLKDTVTVSPLRAVQPQMGAGLSRWMIMLELNTELTVTGGGGGGGAGGRPKSPLHAPGWRYHLVPVRRKKHTPCTTVSPQVQPPQAELFAHRAQQASLEETLLIFGPSEFPWPLVSALELQALYLLSWYGVAKSAVPTACSSATATEFNFSSTGTSSSIDKRG